MGPPMASSGCVIVWLWLVAPGVLLLTQRFGVYANVAAPLILFVPDLTTTLPAAPRPSGAEASSPLVLIWTSAIVKSGSATYPVHGLTAEVMSAPSIRLEPDTIPAP